MCDDCTDAVWQEVYARDDEIDRLKRQVESMTRQRDEWTKDAQAALKALYAMHRLASEPGHWIGSLAVVPAGAIEDVYEAWMTGDFDVR